MEQEKIWDHFQNEGQSDAFSEARPRYISKFLAGKQKVLNIGIGNGYLEDICCSRNIDIHVLDPNSRAISRLREKLHLGERAQVGFAQSNPFDNESFDAVIMSEVLEHLDDGVLASSLNEAKRVLKAGGLMWVSTPYKENLETVSVVCPDCGKIFHRFGHVQSFDEERLSTLLNDAGFVVEKVYVTTFVDWSRPGFKSFVKSLAKVVLAKMGESIADPHLVVIAKRKHG